jgi:hypothetical protein
VGAIVLVALVLGAFAYLIAHSQVQQRRDLDRRFRDRAVVAAAVNEALFSLASAQAKVTDAASFGGRMVGPAALVQRTRQSNGLYAEIIARDGRVLAKTPGAPPRAATPAPYVTEALRTGMTVYSDVFPGAGGASRFESATPFPTVYGTRVDLSGVSGPLIAAFVNGFLGKVPSVAHASSYVIDRNTRIVGSPGASVRPGALLPDRELAAAVARRREGSYGDNRYFTSAAIAGTPWRLVLSASKSDLYASVNGSTRTVPWAIFAAFVLVAGVGIVLVRRVLLARAQLERAELSRVHALEINDNVVQRLVLAKYALDRGATDTSQKKLAETLRETQQLVTSLLEDREIAPGALRRDAPAPTEGPPEPRAPRPGVRP